MTEMFSFLKERMAAEWTDANTRIVTELFAEQVRRGNRPNTHLNSVGYVEVAKRFQEMTGLVYNKTQLKNKWDKLKNGGCMYRCHQTVIAMKRKHGMWLCAMFKL